MVIAFKSYSLRNSMLFQSVLSSERKTTSSWLFRKAASKKSKACSSVSPGFCKESFVGFFSLAKRAFKVSKPFLSFQSTLESKFFLIAAQNRILSL